MLNFLHFLLTLYFCLLQKIEADLEASVVDFFSNLPNVAILCISMLEDDSDFLSNLLPHSPTSVWIVLSRFNSNNVPIFVMLPVASTFQGSSFLTLHMVYFMHLDPCFVARLHENTHLCDIFRFSWFSHQQRLFCTSPVGLSLGGWHSYR